MAGMMNANIPSDTRDKPRVLFGRDANTHIPIAIRYAQ